MKDLPSDRPKSATTARNANYCIGKLFKKATGIDHMNYKKAKEYREYPTSYDPPRQKAEASPLRPQDAYQERSLSPLRNPSIATKVIKHHSKHQTRSKQPLRQKSISPPSRSQERTVTFPTDRSISHTVSHTTDRPITYATERVQSPPRQENVKVSKLQRYRQIEQELERERNEEREIVELRRRKLWEEEAERVFLEKEN